jgi:hypothetical protein
VTEENHENPVGLVDVQGRDSNCVHSECESEALLLERHISDCLYPVNVYKYYASGHCAQSTELVPVSGYQHLSLRLSLTSRPTVSLPVSLGIKHPSGAYDQIFITVRQLRVY